MFSSISESLFGSGSKSPTKNNVNMERGTGAAGSKKMKSSNMMSNEMRAMEALKNELQIKDAAIAALTSKVDRLEDEKLNSRQQSTSQIIKRRQHNIVAESNIIGDNDIRQRVKMGTRGSLLTSHILQATVEAQKTEAQLTAEKFVRVFQDPSKHIAYLSSQEFSNDLIAVCHAVSDVLENQPRCLFMQSPVYVFGDIHGNLEDLHFFADNIWKLGMDLTAGKFLFLGDYVDRGLSCLECVAYLFGLKLLYPNKIEMLRGNHETRDVSRAS
jgi:hypothetical protein